MAQAAVMPRQQQEQAALRTPGKPPLSPQLDNSLITSTVRKRKGDPSELAQQLSPAPPAPGDDGKRQRTPPVDRGLAHGDAVVHITLASPRGGSPPEDWAQQPGAAQHPRQAQQGGGAHGEAAHAPHHHHNQPQPAVVRQGDQEVVLFSPLFHLAREGSRELCEDAADDGGAAAAPPPALQPPAQRSDTDNTSTDQSTGTSASLAMAGGDGGADGDAASPDCRALAPASPAPPPAAAGCEGGGEGCEDECLDFDPLLFIKRLPPLEQCVPPRHEFLLPKKTRRSKQKTLVLDLDETLVHSTLDGYCRPDFMFPVEVGSMRHMVSVRQRPHLHTFLEQCAALYEVVVFTASQRVYAERLLDIVDPQRRLVRHRVYRDSCVLWEGNYLKDLTVLGRNLAHTIIVDNSPQAFGFQLDNGIPIESWYDDDGDEELLKLIPFLEKVAGADDVRPHIQKRYRLRSLVESTADPDAEYGDGGPPGQH